MEELKPGLRRHWVNGQKGMLAQIYFDKGVIVPVHHHENEQFAYVLEGALLFRIGDDQSEEVVVRAGEVLHIPLQRASQCGGTREHAGSGRIRASQAGLADG